ncbi:MAG: metal ABC transporter permease [Planctomycetes bacterium]|nr:metal ABC transporter permease [Planctomycetota bacterium]
MFDWFGQLDMNTQADLWVIAVGAMTNTACALLGCYLVLRRMSMLGDAISHAVLPGLVVAFVLSGSLNIFYMFLGALVVGLLTTVLTETIHRQGSVPADSSMGVVFTSLFALGVILIKRYGETVDLDPDCVLNGLLEMVDFNLVVIGGYELPRAMMAIGPVLAINVLFIVVFWKELLVSSFDPALADTLGIKATLMHYLLMALVALTTVASFEQVGSILVVAMLIVPGATAYLLCDRLKTMLWISAGLACASAVLGHLAAVWLNTNTAGTMAVVVGLFYLTAVFLSPRHGIVVALVRRLRHSVRIVCEDLLGMLYRLEELAAGRRMEPREAVQAVGGRMAGRLGLWSLRRAKQVERVTGGLQLTDDGRHRARGLVRSHRLWEAYLVQFLGLPLDHVHEPAERMEHYIDAQLQQQLAANLDETALDPHGRKIPLKPPADGD